MRSGCTRLHFETATQLNQSIIVLFLLSVHVDANRVELLNSTLMLCAISLGFSLYICDTTKQHKASITIPGQGNQCNGQLDVLANIYIIKLAWQLLAEVQQAPSHLPSVDHNP